MVKSYSEKLQYTKNKLDEIDISAYLKKYTNISDIMFEMSGDYEQQLAEDNILIGDLFNFMSQDEFIDYLHERYNIDVIAHTTYKIIYHE